MSERRHPHVVNADEVEPRTGGAGTRFGFSGRTLGFATGARGIGCSLYEVPPGRAAFPYHFHCANEEALYVLEGEGTLRLGGETVAVRAGDYITCPIGPDGAHQLTNTGAGPLRYLCVSTLSTAEVVGYPDSKKLGALAADSQASAFSGKAWVRVVIAEGASAGYYDGEDIG
jgi:uncharacterized cupin superfamily protein